MKTIFFSGLLAILILCSCTKKQEHNPYLDIKISEDNPEVPYKQLEYKMIFPDTVLVNKPYKATIEFKSDFDTIIPPIQIDEALDDTTKTRLITFYYFEPIKSPMGSETNLTLIDSAFVLNEYFELENIIFKEKGEFTFCGLLEDSIMYNHYNEKGVRDSVHFERKKQQIFKKVVVID